MISGSIQALFEDTDGALWIATPYGVGRIKGGKFTSYTVRDGLGSNSIRAIQQDRDGRLWFGSLGGLTSFNGSRFTTYTTRDGLPNDRIISLHANRDGGLLIGTAGGLCLFKDGRFTSFNPGEALSTSTILSLLEDREGKAQVEVNGTFRPLAQPGLASKVTSQTWKRSVPPAVAGGLTIEFTILGQSRMLIIHPPATAGGTDLLQ